MILEAVYEFMKIKNQVALISIYTTLIVVLLSSGCSHSTRHDGTSTINPKGVFAQLLRIDARDKSEKFELLMAQLVQVAASNGLDNPYHWICYYEAPDHYWLLSISDSLENFAHPGSIEGFASAIAAFGTSMDRNEIFSLSEDLKELPVTRNVTQQYSNWSTTNNVESRDFPKSRIVIYQINETDLLAFHESMTELSTFLSSNNITFQVEGFIAYPRTLNAAWQVIFLPENASFDAVHKNYEFSIALDSQALDKLRSIQEKLESHTIGIASFDGIRIDTLSYGTQ